MRFLENFKHNHHHHSISLGLHLDKKKTCFNILSFSMNHPRRINDTWFIFQVSGLLNSNIWHRHAEVKLTKSKLVLQTAIVSVRLGNSQMCLSVSQHLFFWETNNTTKTKQKKSSFSGTVGLNGNIVCGEIVGLYKSAQAYSRFYVLFNAMF